MKTLFTDTPSCQFSLDRFFGNLAVIIFPSDHPARQAGNFRQRPKICNVGIPNAEARCALPESLPINQAEPW